MTVITNCIVRDDQDWNCQQINSNYNEMFIDIQELEKAALSAEDMKKQLDDLEKELGKKDKNFEKELTKMTKSLEKTKKDAQKGMRIVDVFDLLRT